MVAFDRALDRFRTSPGGVPDVTNDAGQLTWGKGYVLLALIRVYQATRQASYLDRFLEIANQVLDQTDQARGVSDYQGRSGPVWRAAGVYTAGHAVLKSRSSEPIVEIRYAGQNSGSASVAVSPGSRPTTFSLALTHPGSPTVRVINVSTDPQHSRYVTRAVLQEVYRPTAQWTARVVGAGVPAVGTTTLTPEYCVFAVSTGMITYPLALYARTVLEDHTLSSGQHRSHAERFLAAAHGAMAFHESEWAHTSDGFAGYRAPSGAPVAHDGDFLPFNQSNAMGQTLAELYRITGQPAYADKVTRLARAWRAALTPMPIGGVGWPYWPPFSKVYAGYSAGQHVSSYSPSMPPTRHLDDVSHAAITVEFAVAAHAAGIGITGSDRKHLIQTYLDNLRTGSRTIRSRFDGPNAAPATAIQAARWIGLGDRRIARHAQSVVRADEPGWTDGSTVLGYGYLAWATGRGLI